MQQNSAELMNYIIKDILDYSQIKSGMFRPNLSLFNIKDTVQKVMAMQAQKAKDKKINFEVVYKNILDDQDSLRIGMSPDIFSDEQRIMQVLLCLQSNAIKFTQKGEVKTVVEII